MATKKAGKISKAKNKKAVVFGIDDMVSAVFETINRNEEFPASAQDLTKKAIKAVIQVEQEIRESALANGDSVAYVGHGTYKTAQRSARKGRNPQTGEEIDIPASVVPVFKPGKAFKDVIKANVAIEDVAVEVVAEEAPAKKGKAKK